MITQTTMHLVTVPVVTRQIVTVNGKPTTVVSTRRLPTVQAVTSVVAHQSVVIRRF